MAYKINDEMYGSHEELVKAVQGMSENIFVIERVDDSQYEHWKQQKEKIDTIPKEYKPADFLRDAKNYETGENSGGKPNLIQASEKLWLAAAYAVKIYFLENMDVHLDSHRAIRYFVDLATNEANDIRTAIQLDRAFGLAENHHEFAYGQKLFVKGEFAGNHEEIGSFVKYFLEIDPTKVKQKVTKLINELKNTEGRTNGKVTYKEFGKRCPQPTLGGETYEPEHIFY